MSIEAMKQALEALRCIESPLHVWEINKIGGAMNALRQAIERAKKQDPVTWFGDADGFPVYAAPVHASDMSQERVDETAKRGHEPVEYDCCANCLRPEHEHNGTQCPKPLTTVWHAWDYDFPPDNYTAPLKREWVGLTAKDLAEIPPSCYEGAIWADAKLREKNT